MCGTTEIVSSQSICGSASAPEIFSSSRGPVAEQEQQEAAAVKIQKFYRGYKERQVFLKAKKAAPRLQRWWIKTCECAPMDRRGPLGTWLGQHGQNFLTHTVRSGDVDALMKDGFLRSTEEQFIRTLEPSILEDIRQQNPVPEVDRSRDLSFHRHQSGDYEILGERRCSEMEESQHNARRNRLSEDLCERLNITPTKARLLIDRFLSKKPIDSKLSELYDTHARLEISDLYKKHEVGVLDDRLLEEHIVELLRPFFTWRENSIPRGIPESIRNYSNIMNLNFGSVVVLIGNPETKRSLPVFEQEHKTRSQHTYVASQGNEQVCFVKKSRRCTEHFSRGPIHKTLAWEGRRCLLYPFQNGGAPFHVPIKNNPEVVIVGPEDVLGKYRKDKNRDDHQKDECLGDYENVVTFEEMSARQRNFLGVPRSYDAKLQASLPHKREGANVVNIDDPEWRFLQPAAKAYRLFNSHYSDRLWMDQTLIDENTHLTDPGEKSLRALLINGCAIRCNGNVERFQGQSRERPSPCRA